MPKEHIVLNAVKATYTVGVKCTNCYYGWAHSDTVLEINVPEGTTVSVFLVYSRFKCPRCKCHELVAL